MDYATNIDAYWAAFCDTLPRDCRADADELACRLGLVPESGIGWSDVFKHEITLAAPALFASAMRQASPAMVRDAVMAHMLAIIEAFATDRIHDGQTTASASLTRLLEQLGAVRDRSIEALTGLGTSTYPEAVRRALAAISTERALLEDGGPLSFSDYMCLSLGKQAMAFPASIALAEAAGWAPDRRRVIRRILEDITLGLQLSDDVVDWEDDWQHGSAWAVSLSRGTGNNPDRLARHTDFSTTRRLVHESGVLARMLEEARCHYREAAGLATDIGATPVALWAEQQQQKTGQLAELEAESAGYAVRAHHLSAWAAEVLS